MVVEPDETTKRAQHDLARLAADRDTLGTSAIARMAKHMAGADAPSDDPVEVWGKRIGRALGAVFFVFLAGSLLMQLLG